MNQILEEILRNYVNSGQTRQLNKIVLTIELLMIRITYQMI